MQIKFTNFLQNNDAYGETYDDVGYAPPVPAEPEEVW